MKSRKINCLLIKPQEKMSPFWKGFHKYLKSLYPRSRHLSKDEMSQMLLTYT